jgi:hypothetical protein
MSQAAALTTGVEAAVDAAGEVQAETPETQMASTTSPATRMSM